MAENPDLLNATASIIADYREGEIDQPDAAHIENWLAQFDQGVRGQLLSEINHILGQTYIPRKKVEEFLSGLVNSQKLAGEQPKDFWIGAKFLDLQEHGSSQRELIAMTDVPLKSEVGYGVAECGAAEVACFVYLDDGLFTGNTILNDLKGWLKGAAPKAALVHVIVMALHRGGQYYAQTQLAKTAKEVGKEIEFKWWRIFELEDRRAYIKDSDVLRPTKIPEDDVTKVYAASLKFPPTLRPAGSVGGLKIFSSENGRELIEQQLLIKGAYIRTVSPHLKEYARPLGNMVLSTLGFGSTIATFRNCPNNAPLAFWAGDPWYPLFPRKTN
jgi:hypothetical protein